MALLWTQPRNWITREPITKEKLNAISDDLLYLFNPSFQMVTITNGTNQTTASTTMVDLDAASYGLTVELTGSRAVNVEMSGMWSQATLAAFVYLDVFIDNSIYLSSLTATPLSTGLTFAQAYVAAAYSATHMKRTIPAGFLSAGVHTFKPRWRVSGGTGTWYEATVHSQFKVGEY